ncbi:MAG: DUF2946 family protein [Amylibacter sp.]|nr:DUF2946 family protein [Amylibacter sp.]
MLGFIPVVAWLFIQLVMISAWSPGVSASPALAGQAVVICSGDGLVTIYFDADGNPIEGDAQSTQPCKWCTSFSGAPTLTKEIQPAPFELRLVEYVYSIQPSTVWKPRVFCDGFPIRAPPRKA